MLGDGGALPFLGHARSYVETPGARMWIASRLFSGGDVVAAYEASRRFCEAMDVLSRKVPETTDRNDLIRLVWEFLANVSRDELGTRGGDDLQLLVVAEDAEGQAVAGVGLSMVYGRSEEAWTMLVNAEHPLLCGPGLPKTIPGVLTLDSPVQQVIGIPDHLDGTLPVDFDVHRSCGWMP